MIKSKTEKVARRAACSSSTPEEENDVAASTPKAFGKIQFQF